MARGATGTVKASPRAGRKGHMYGPPIQHPGPSKEEQVRIITRRMVKAERDERVDITLSLSEVKTCV